MKNDSSLKRLFDIFYSSLNCICGNIEINSILTTNLYDKVAASYFNMSNMKDLLLVIFIIQISLFNNYRKQKKNH